MSEKKNNKIGLFGTIALVFSGMVGAGILVLPKKLAVYGSWSFIAWFVSAYMTYCIFQSFVSVRKIYILKYNFVQDPGILDFLSMLYCENTSFLIAFGHFMALTMSAAVISMALGSYFITFMPNNFPLCSNSIAILSLIFIFITNFLSIKFANYLNQSLSLIKFIFFVAVAIAGFTFYKNYQFNFQGINMAANIQDVCSASAKAMFAFMGIEFAVFASGSIENSEINVPKGTLIGLILATLVFVGVYSAAVFVLPDVVNCDTSVMEASKVMFGEMGGFLVGIVAMLSCVTTLLGICIVQGNAFKNFTKKGLMPASFGIETSENFPWLGALASLLISALWIISNSFLRQSLGIDISEVSVIFVAFTYLSVILINLIYTGLNLNGILALISGLIMLCIINKFIMIIIVSIYIFSYLLKKFLKEENRI